jgi:S-disulfanyl-L-cysteine oxidoreductase SoxD
MSMPRRAALAASVALLLAACAAQPGARSTPTQAPRLGVVTTAAEAGRFDLDVFPDGRGLPAGRGSVAQGAPLFARHCASCHGTRGRGASAEELVGGSEPLNSAFPDKTIGLYWPHATTLFDFIRRSKPMLTPGSLSADEVYALTAWLLAADGVIAADAELDAAKLAAVKMPNRNGFIGIDAKPTR